LHDWKNISQQKLDAVVQDYQQVNNEIIHSSSTKKAEALKLLPEAKYNIDLVEIGKSVHNVQFADELLRGAHEIITNALKLVDSKTVIRPYQETSKLVPAECNTCHFGVEVEARQIWGTEFSHTKHVVDRQLNCETCHSNERRHGELTMTKSKCATCHHQEDTEDCSTCHALQFSVYSGTLDKVKYPTIEPDVMFQAEVGCIACHPAKRDEINKSVVPSTQSCLDCHDEESYIKTYNTWRENSIKVIAAIDNWLLQNRNLMLTDHQRDQVNLVKEARTLIKIDNSKGVHNPKFYESVLKQCQDTLNKINPGGTK